MLAAFGRLEEEEQGQESCSVLCRLSRPQIADIEAVSMQMTGNAYRLWSEVASDHLSSQDPWAIPVEKAVSSLPVLQVAEVGAEVRSWHT